MVYNFNLGVGWASSGVEYAQAYRAKVLREIGQDAKFIFTDMFPRDNIQHMTENIGFLDSEVIWLYTFFTDCKTSFILYSKRSFREIKHKKSLRNIIPFLDQIVIMWLIWLMRRETRFIG